MNIAPLASILFLWIHSPATTSLLDTISDATTSLLNTVPVESLEGIVSGASDDDLAAISLSLYTGNTSDHYTNWLVGDAVYLLYYMDWTRPTVFYVFGWTESPEAPSTLTVMDAYLARGDHNVIVINWEHIAGELYPFAAVSVKTVGITVARALDDMVAAGLDPSTIHIVGHSLGSQIAGAIGRNTKFNVPRIIGLDPAGPGFYIIVAALKATDASHVVTIHTDAGILGTATGDGIADFWPNGGTRYQPGCPIVDPKLMHAVTCSHARSCKFYAESLLNETAFIAVPCKSYLYFKLGMCYSKENVVMGFATPTTASGSYYLETNSESPFGKG